jgi:putative transposase
MAEWAVREWAVSIRSACQTIGLSEICYRYRSKLGSENQQIVDWLLRLTE